MDFKELSKLLGSQGYEAHKIAQEFEDEGDFVSARIFRASTMMSANLKGFADAFIVMQKELTEATPCSCTSRQGLGREMPHVKVECARCKQLEEIK